MQGVSVWVQFACMRGRAVQNLRLWRCRVARSLPKGHVLVEHVKLGIDLDNVILQGLDIGRPGQTCTQGVHTVDQAAVVGTFGNVSSNMSCYKATLIHQMNNSSSGL